MRELKTKTKPKPIIVTDDKGKVAGTTAKKIELITKYFTEALAPESRKHERRDKPIPPKSNESQIHCRRNPESC